ncbi:hypothetical protein JTE90_017798 [Oedothorax gibbosus]|uniref:Uncharacterized protein n=1 Tax=Oedothorax gibbosus TaxID=931172 RepID=A0AAV6U6K8_9ARAC|nr:hypothetical protein JTE90_017798 [Oedothorax gibbosus]
MRKEAARPADETADHWSEKADIGQIFPLDKESSRRKQLISFVADRCVNPMSIDSGLGRYSFTPHVVLVFRHEHERSTVTTLDRLVSCASRTSCTICQVLKLAGQVTFTAKLRRK